MDSVLDRNQDVSLQDDKLAICEKEKSELEERGSECTDNLETFLNDIFKEEIEFTIEQEEVTFIQLGVERLMMKIADIVTEQAGDTLETTLRSDIKRIQTVTGIQFVERKTSERILKVGSFYEKTKTKFPDEFDFIFVLKTLEIHEECQDNLYKSAVPFILIEVHAEIAAILEQKESIEQLKYVYTGPKGERMVAFEKTTGIAGPSLKLEVKYYDYHGQETKIDVDFVPGYQIYDQNSKKRINTICSCPEFSQELARIGRYCFVKDNMTFTETEIYFMTNVLSAKHVRVYRIVKYLINGHTDSGELENECRQQETTFVHIPTYRIKIVTIFHHFTCTHTDGDNLSMCVLELLLTLTNHYKAGHSWPHVVNRSVFLRPYIGKTVNSSKSKRYREIGLCVMKNLYESLLSLQKSAKPYIYKDICIAPFSRSLVREIRCCEWPESSDFYVWYG